MTACPMMACGHIANATCSMDEGTIYDPEIPCCVICDCIVRAELEPDLTGRVARCSMAVKGDKHPLVPSNPDLAFFEYRGPGSRAATWCRYCGASKKAHDPAYMKRRRTVVEEGRCRGYEALTEGRETDSYYCGCRGWD